MTEPINEVIHINTLLYGFAFFGAMCAIAMVLIIIIAIVAGVVTDSQNRNDPLEDDLDWDERLDERRT